MKITNYLCRRLEGHILSASEHYHAADFPRGIRLLDSTTKPCAGEICIADAAVLRDWEANGYVPENAYIFLTAGAGDLSTYACLDAVSCYATDLELIPLYNFLLEASWEMGIVSTPQSAGHERFADFINAVISQQLSRGADIQRHLRDLPHTNDMPFRILVMEFEQEPTERVARSGVLDELTSCFPHSNASFYFGRVIAMVQIENWNSDLIAVPKIMIDALQSLCERYSAWCGVSSLCRNFEMIRTNCIYARDVIEIGKKMCDDRKNRVYLVEDYTNYFLIDMAYREYCRAHPHKNYAYLIYPGLCSVIRYDQRHNNNLRDTLYTFLLYDRNYSKTAEVMHMHRNTVLYKVGKATELLEESLDDPVIRQRVLWSCTFVDYCIRCLGVEPQIYPLAHSEPGNENYK